VSSGESELLEELAVSRLTRLSASISAMVVLRINASASEQTNETSRVMTMARMSQT